MSLTDLRGTKWVLKGNGDIVQSGTSEWHIFFSSNSVDFSTRFSPSSFHGNTDIYYDGTKVYSSGSWTNQAYRIITITGGDDSDSSSGAFAHLLSWLETNATQIQILDLTETKWILNDNSVTYEPFSYSINYNINENGTLKAQNVFVSSSITAQLDEPPANPVTFYYLQGSNTSGTVPSTSNILSYRNPNNQNYYWYIDARAIEISGGTDVTNPNLIMWLTNNATLVPVVNLTNTHWMFGIYPNIQQSIITYNINYTVHWNDGTMRPDENYSMFRFGGMDTGAEQYIDTIWTSLNNYPYIYCGGWQGPTPVTIIITGGTDTINPDFLVWLANNATLLVTNDLTNTKWIFNSTLTDFTTLENLSIAFTIGDNPIEYARLSVVYEQPVMGDEEWQLKFDSTRAYGVVTGWNSTNFRRISFGTGTAATNPELIAWIQNNATQVEVLNLTDTTWTINSINCEAGYGEFEINFNINTSPYYIFYIGYELINFQVGRVPTVDSILISSYPEYLSTNDIIEITSGTDATNPELLVWMNEHATYNEPPPPPPPIPSRSHYSSFKNISLTEYGNHITLSIDNVDFNLSANRIYSISTSIENGTSGGDTEILSGDGTAQITIIPSEGYSVPSDVSVSGANYSYSNGVISLSNATGNVTISATCESLGYTIDFSNLEVDPNADVSTLTVYDGQDATGVELFTLTWSLTPPRYPISTLVFTSGNFYITWTSTLASNFNNVTSSGGCIITDKSTTDANTTFATGTITGNGSISGYIYGDA